MLPNIDALSDLRIEESVGVLLYFGNGVQIKDVIFSTVFYLAYIISLFVMCVCEKFMCSVTLPYMCVLNPHVVHLKLNICYTIVSNTSIKLWEKVTPSVRDSQLQRD